MRNSQSAILGLISGVIVVLVLGAALPAGTNSVGRFQVAGTASHGIIVDTQTGQAWTTLLSQQTGTSDRDFRKPKLVESQPSADQKEQSANRNDLRSRMLGTWQLVSFTDGRVSDANEGELKFIGERHWSVSRLKPGTSRLDYHMGGTYTLNGDEYVETIEYGTGGPIGETFTYKLTVDEGKFMQTGIGNPWSLVFKRAK